MALDPVLLKAFVAVAERGSMTRGAEALSLTQSAVSAQIRRLEEVLGCRLFDRTTRSLELSSRGVVLLGYARSILSLQDQALARLSPKLSDSTLIRLGCSEGFPTDWLFDALARFRDANPNVQIDVVSDTSTELAKLLQAQALDLTVGVACKAPFESAMSQTLWMEPLVWAFSNQSLLDPERPIPLGFLQEPCPFREAALEALSHHALPWRLVLSAQSASVLVSALTAGLIVTALMPSGMPPGLSPIPPGRVLPELPMAACVLQHGPAALSESAQQLASHIVDACFRWRGSAAQR